MNTPRQRGDRPTDHDRAVAWRRAAVRAKKAKRRLRNRLVRELAAAKGAPQLRQQGEVLKTQLHKVPRGADRVTLHAPWMDPSEVVVHLRRDLSPKANLERIFRRAKGLGAARASISKRLDECDKAADALDRALIELTDIAAALRAEESEKRTQQNRIGTVLPSAIEPSCMDEALDPRRRLAAVIGQLRSIGVKLPVTDATAALDKHARKRLAGKARVLPKGVVAFQTANGKDVIAGRSAAANDTLVTRLARGRDIWMHVRDRTGAHLLLRMKHKDAPPAHRDLLDCAMLVAHLSGVAKGDRVEVSWTRAKNVRKVRGMPAGQVFIAGEKTLLVQVEGDVIDAFYARKR